MTTFLPSDEKFVRFFNFNVDVTYPIKTNLFVILVLVSFSAIIYVSHLGGYKLLVHVCQSIGV